VRAQRHTYNWLLPFLLVIDALKCVVWGGRALVVGFAGGEIEKVRVILLARTRRHCRSLIGNVGSTASTKLSTAEDRLDHWHLLGFLSK
jgi:hypothetical protein